MYPGARPAADDGAEYRRIPCGAPCDDSAQTGYGFRTMASTLLNELGFALDVIELQLAHAERNKVRATYNNAQRLAEGRRTMQTWATTSMH